MRTEKEIREYKRIWAQKDRIKNPDRYRKNGLKHHHKNRNEWLTKNGPCKNCGSKKRLEVDHINPSSKIDHNVWKWSQSRRDLELKKCQVLCFICHRLKTNKERKWKIHGELMWQIGCRCCECIRVHNKKLRRLIRLGLT